MVKKFRLLLLSLRSVSGCSTQWDCVDLWPLLCCRVHVETSHEGLNMTFTERPFPPGPLCWFLSCVGGKPQRGGFISTVWNAQRLVWHTRRFCFIYLQMSTLNWMLYISVQGLFSFHFIDLNLIWGVNESGSEASSQFYHPPPEDVFLICLSLVLSPQTKRTFMSGVLETYEKLLGKMLEQLPTLTPPTAGAAVPEAGADDVRKDLMFILKRIRDLRSFHYQEQSKLLQRLNDLGNVKVRDTSRSHTRAPGAAPQNRSGLSPEFFFLMKTQQMFPNRRPRVWLRFWILRYLICFC